MSVPQRHRRPSRPSTKLNDRMFAIYGKTKKGTTVKKVKMSGYSIVRCQGAGVFMAKIVFRKSTEAKLKDSRRLWYWSGAASLSQLAVEGTKKPEECKFPIAMPEQEVTGVLEVIPVSVKAKASIDSVPVWQLK